MYFLSLSVWHMYVWDMHTLHLLPFILLTVCEGLWCLPLLALHRISLRHGLSQNLELAILTRLPGSTSKLLGFTSLPPSVLELELCTAVLSFWCKCQGTKLRSHACRAGTLTPQPGEDTLPSYLISKMPSEARFTVEEKQECKFLVGKKKWLTPLSSSVFV